MTIIKATCPVCGDVELTSEQIRLVMHPVRDRSFYEFVCGTCDEEIRKPAGPEVVRLLKLGGVVAETPDIPGEALEERPETALTMDEVLDFIAWLDGATAIAAAAGTGLHRRVADSDSEGSVAPQA